MPPGAAEDRDRLLARVYIHYSMNGSPKIGLISVGEWLQIMQVLQRGVPSKDLEENGVSYRVVTNKN